ncbi:MAG: sugar phosphate isomerase/epimerase [Bacteroidales bacterium]|jgi:sugar phosphate isomerase/epimerase|nr:sugar phosphate isomerase/epimerase [Bacteroidales bacterium]
MLVRRDFLKKSSLLVAAGFSGINLFASERAKLRKTPSFRISLNTSTIEPYKLPVTKQIELCAETGFDGIELWISDIQQYLNQGGKVSVLAGHIQSSGLKLENMIGFAAWASDDDTVRKKGQIQMKEEMELTARLGGRYIAAPVIGISKIDGSKLEVYADRYRHILEEGEKIGITPLLELWGAGTLNKLSDASHIAIGAAHKSANLLLDFYHLYRGNNSFDSLMMVNTSRMPLFHINDYPSTLKREQLSDSDRVYPGDGICPFPSIIPELFENGFRGAFSVELFNKEYCSQNTVQQVLLTSLNKTRKVIEAALV